MCGGHYLGVLMAISEVVVAISGCVVCNIWVLGGNIYMSGWQYLLVLDAISGCVGSNILECGWQFMGVLMVIFKCVLCNMWVC